MAVTPSVGLRIQYNGNDGTIARVKVMGVVGADVRYDNGNRNCYVGANYTVFCQNATAL